MDATVMTIPRMGRKRKEVDESKFNGRVAVRLRALREKKKVSVAQMAKALKIGATAYYYYETGERDMPLSSIPVICRVLGVRPSRFLPD